MLTHLNQIVTGDCVELMQQLPDNLIPLTVTSPPFDDMRDFDGWLDCFDFEELASELYRVTCDGGVVCWHVQDQITDGCESCTSALQKLYFRNLGFRVQTLIVETTAYCDPGLRYGPSVQYLFTLTKGRPRVFNPIIDIPNKTPGRERVYRRRDPNGSLRAGRSPYWAEHARERLANFQLSATA